MIAKLSVGPPPKYPRTPESGDRRRCPELLDR
jgi:hypothetical protein